MTRLKRKFFERDTLKVAEELLGKILVREIGGKTIKGRIVETEAYIGVGDKACHARHGKTKRNEVMWGEAGYAYIYLCMGLHNLLNIVTEKEDFPAAVLIRKIEPLSGFDAKLKSYGPGNLTKYLQIDSTLNGLDITSSDQLMIIDDGYQVLESEFQKLPRVGIDYAEEHKDLPWRFVHMVLPHDLTK